MAIPDATVRDLLRASSRTSIVETPVPDEDLLEFLEATFPPRCYDPSAETLEDHLKYAGKVDLVQAMRLAYDRAEEARIPPIPLDP